MKSLNSESLAIIILAAGQSSRLGQMKQLVNYDGKSLLRLQCLKALAISSQVYCVLGFQHERLRDEIAHLPVKVLFNESWLEGLSSSIVSAIASLPTNISHAMFILVDQWQLTSNHLQQLKEKMDINAFNVITATLDNTSSVQGPPVIFPKRLFSALAMVTGKNGAKEIIQKEVEQLTNVVLPEAFTDLDTPKDLDYMNETLKR